MKNTKSIMDKRIINKNFLFKLINFNWKLLNKNISFWLIFSLFILGNVIVSLILLVLDKTYLLNFSFLNYLISFVFSLIFIFYCVTKLFLESKYTSVDLIMRSKPYNQINVYLSRFLLVLFLIFIVNFFHFIIVSIFILSFGLEINWILYNFISCIFINTFLATLSISLFILFAILFKKILFIIISFLTIFLVSFSVITRAFDTNIKIDYSSANYNSFSKLITIDKNNGKVNSYLVDKVNLISNVNKRNGYDYVNNDNFWNYLIPGEWFSSLTSSLASNVLSYENKDNQKHNYSLVKNFYQNINFINNSNLEIISIRPNDINPLLLTNEEYEDLLINNINSIINDNNVLNLNDTLLASSFLNKIQNTTIWNTEKLSFKEYNTLFLLFGFNPKYSQLFYYWNYNKIFKNKVPNLFEKLRLKYNENLVKLLEFIYSTNDACINIWNLKVFGEIEDLYPISLTIKENELPNVGDINFIVNNLVRFNENVVSYLDMNYNYQTTSISDLQELSPNIIDFASWKQYVLENTMTYANTQELLSNLNNLLPNMYQLLLNPNYFDVYQYSYYFKQHQTTYLNYNNLLLSLIIIVTIYINTLSIYKYKKINYKNTES